MWPSRVLKLLLNVTFLFCIALGVALQTFSQPKNLQFSYLTLDDGLSSSSINSFLQDEKGYMWVGTYDGLNRFDGVNFTVYKHNSDDSSSIADNLIWNIFIDHNNNLLFCTEHGLCKYNWETDDFLNYNLAKSSPLAGVDFSLHNVAEDTLGNLWLAANIALFYFDRKNNRAEQYLNDPNDPSSISNSYTESVYIDRDEMVWVTTQQGLNLFLPETGTFELITRGATDQDDYSDIFFTDIIEDHEGNLWFGSTKGLFCLKYNSKFTDKRLIHYQHNPNDAHSISNNQIISLLIDDKNILWVGTENGGLNLLNRENEEFCCYRINDYDPKSLNNESIQAIYQDKIGNMWVGTFAGGINISKKNSGSIRLYEKLPGAEQSLSHNAVLCFLEDYKNRIWVGTDGGGLNLFDWKINRFSCFNMENANFSSDAILCMDEYPNKVLWLGTWAGGLIRFDTDTRTATSLNTSNSNILDDNIYAVAKGDKNDLWLGSFEHGLIHYNIDKNKFTHFDQSNSPTSNNMIIVIKKDTKGNLFLGSPSSFEVYKPDSNKFISYQHGSNGPNQIGVQAVTDIFVENDTTVWIGTQYGLIRFNPETETFTRYTVEDGLPSNFIQGIILKEAGILWLSTNNGVCRFDVNDKEKIMILTNYDGLQSNEFSPRSRLKNIDGKLFFGGKKGFNIILPDQFAANENIPKVLITDFHIFNKPVKAGTEGSPLMKHISITKHIDLSYKQSVLTFYFAVMDFTVPEKNQYAYYLENFEEGWIFSGNKREATYTNLDPGNYVLHVKGSNNDGVWNEEGVELSITILPPWWQTIWFKIFAFLFILSFIIGFYYLRLNQLSVQKHKLEKMVKQRTAEIEEKNSMLHKQTNELNNINTLLEEQNQHMEEQNEVLLDKTKKLNDSNILLEESQQRIEEKEKELLKEKYLMDTLMNNLPDYIYFKDLKSRFIKNSKSHALSFGRSDQNEVLGKSDFDFFDDEHATTAYKNEQDIIKTGKAIINYIEKESKKDGSIRWVTSTKMPLKDKGGNIVGTFGISKDITENREMQMEIIEKNETLLAQEEKLLVQQEELKAQAEELIEKNNILITLNATKDKFFSIIAHDLKNPFASILGFCEILLTRYDKYEDSKRKQLIGVIEQSAQNIYKLLENLLQWARSQTGNMKFSPEEFNLLELVENNKTLVNNSLTEKGLILVHEISPDLRINADKNMINTVIRNLLTNSIKFSEEGEIKVVAKDENDSIYISITDRGKGIRKEMIDKIFEIEKSKSTEGTRGESGTGLGLIICKEFIEKHQGSIRAESEYGKGSTFFITLPKKVHN